MNPLTLLQRLPPGWVPPALRTSVDTVAIEDSVSSLETMGDELPPPPEE
jgi:hypothetical protein